MVFDGSSGFATGGGWIDSPAGAYTADSSLSGKSSFGFVAKYKNGANTPDGNTESQFRAAGFNFHSTDYQFLMVAGAKTKFKGKGSVNGVDGYGFLLTGWEEGFYSLQVFTASEGHARPPYAHKENEYNLGGWVSNQRRSQDKLTPERIARLEALPGWAWDTRVFAWEEGFSYLQRFTASKGHARPTHDHKEDGYNLGSWVIRQRVFRDKLTQEQVSRLEALPGWTWDPRELLWEEGFSALKRFTVREGHARPPKGHKEGGYNLGTWARKKRSSHNTLTPERIAQLEALPGWVWDVLECQWEEGFSALQRFTIREGHARPPKGHKEGGYNLGTWVSVQRRSHDKLTPERIAQLEALPGWVWDGNPKRRST